MVSLVFILYQAGETYSSLFLSDIREQSHRPPEAQSSVVADGSDAYVVVPDHERDGASDSEHIVARVSGLGAAWDSVVSEMMMLSSRNRYMLKNARLAS